MVTKTLGIIKPDAVEKALIGRIVDRIEEDGRFRFTDFKWVRMTPDLAMLFYAEHTGRPYYDKLVRFMASGPCLAFALESKDDTMDAVVWWRSIMRDIRGRYADPDHSERNCVHGSDSAESAARELAFFGFSVL